MKRSKTRILVVDDEEIIQRFLQEVIRREGYAASTASTGEEALRLAKKRRFAVIVVDLALPDQTGKSVAQEISRISPGAKFILLSGGNFERGDFKEIPGVISQLSKPFMVEEFARELKRAVGTQ